MDPITAGLTLANSIVTLITKIWDATPAADQAVRAADFARTAHNCSALLEKITGAPNVPAPR